MARFAQSAATVPEPCIVLGTPLKPFCLGHHLLFKRLNLPFAGDPTAESSIEEILLGIAVCAQSYEDTLNQFLDGSWEAVFSKWNQKLKKQFASRRFFFRKKLDKSLVSIGAALFRCYLQDGYEHCPVNKHLTVKGISLTAPWEILLKNKLVMAGYNNSEVLNGFLPGCWYDYYSVTELNAAANCADPAKWRRIFYTEEDAAVILKIRQRHKNALSEIKEGK